MEITFRIDPSYASPTEMVSLINAMQGLAATMGGTMSNRGDASVRAAPRDGDGRTSTQQQVAMAAPPARVEDMLEAALGPFENQVNAAAPGLPSDDAIHRAAEKIDAASRACVGEEPRFAKLLFARVANHAFSPRAADSVLAWVDLIARISVEQLRETVRNLLTQRALKTMTKPARTSAGGQASMIQPAICFAAMIKFTMIKMDGTCDTIAALLQQPKTAAAAILVLKQVLRICPTQLARGASNAKMEKLLAAVQRASLQQVEGAGMILAELQQTRSGAAGGSGGGTFNERQPHTLVHQVSHTKNASRLPLVHFTRIPLTII